MTEIYNIFIIFLLSIIIFIPESGDIDPLKELCNTASKIQRPQISSNINSFLPRIVRATTENGFFISSYGQAGDTVFGLGQCRGDVSKQDCSTCLQNATKEITKRCTNQADAMIFYDYCFLRYNTKNFFYHVDTSGYIIWSLANVKGVEDYNKTLNNLVDEIRAEAVKPGNLRLGKGKKKLNDFLTLYAVVQCTRDLNPSSCEQCLAEAVVTFPKYCGNKQGCRVLLSSCYFRYELYPFYFPRDAQNTKQDVKMKYHHIVSYTN